MDQITYLGKIWEVVDVLEEGAEQSLVQLVSVEDDSIQMSAWIDSSLIA